MEGDDQEAQLEDSARGEENQDADETDEENIDEEEVIDVAERIFIRIAEQLTALQCSSIRDVFKEDIFVNTEF